MLTMKVVAQFIVQHKLLFLAFLYFSFRLPYLTLLPIFNDEAIYLDWGMREISVPGFLFYSLYDAKQPLLMWIFGICQKLFTDPLFAGRFVSVCSGFITMLGIYKVTKLAMDEKAGVVASILYICVPIFSFYDRQALMESSVAAVGVWTVYYLLQFIEKQIPKYAVMVGVILGIGFFIKSSVLVFLITTIIVLTLYAVREKQGKKVIKNGGIMLGSFIVVNSLLFIQPLFWKTLSSNTRYSLSLSEILHFPIEKWLYNFSSNLEIAVLFLSPLVFISAIFGVFLLLRQRKEQKLQFVLQFFTVSILLLLLTQRNPLQRYLVSFLPPFLIMASFCLIVLMNKYKRTFLSIGLVSVVVIQAAIITGVQIISPITYFTTLSRVTNFSDKETYITGWTSGYAVMEAISFIRQQPSEAKKFVGFALNTGNPESALLVYFRKSNAIGAGYLDRKLFEQDLTAFDCIASSSQIYFVSREEQLAGLDSFLHKIKTIYNPHGDNTVGIYTLKPDCEGKTLTLNP